LRDPLFEPARKRAKGKGVCVAGNACLNARERIANERNLNLNTFKAETALRVWEDLARLGDAVAQGCVCLNGSTVAQHWLSWHESLRVSGASFPRDGQWHRGCKSSLLKLTGSSCRCRARHGVGTSVSLDDEGASVSLGAGATSVAPSGRTSRSQTEQLRQGGEVYTQSVALALRESPRIPPHHLKYRSAPPPPSPPPPPPPPPRPPPPAWPPPPPSPAHTPVRA